MHQLNKLIVTIFAGVLTLAAAGFHGDTPFHGDVEGATAFHEGTPAGFHDGFHRDFHREFHRDFHDATADV